MRVLGIMSGTSIDGADYALCDISENTLRLRRLWQVKFPAALRKRLHLAAQDRCSGHELAQLHHDLGQFYASHAPDVWSELIGLHGQTVYHNPNRTSPATLQIGEPAWLAEKLRVPVASNFRSGDLAAGGQGAPLATIFHYRVFARRGQHVCVNNLGGISNVTSIDWRAGGKPVIVAFDTGPANVLMDIASRQLSKGVRQFDRNGYWARRGKVHEKILQQWLKHPFFHKRPPKSTGRELFGELFWRRELARLRRAGANKFDILATLTALTSRSIVMAYATFLGSMPNRVILTGGGAANSVLRKFISEDLRRINPSIEIVTSEALGWPVQSIEAAAFAFLAWLRFHNEPVNIPATTGANRPLILGQITAG